jgi:hypothetical protein
MRSAWRQHVLVFAAYVVLMLVQSWPLPLKLSTHLTGTPAGDAGVYVWNIWVFSHEIVDTGTTPLSTAEILPLGDPTGAEPTDLSLHNYTIATDLLAVPLIGWLGVVRTFNILFFFNGALAAFGVYLARPPLDAQRSGVVSRRPDVRMVRVPDDASDSDISAFTRPRHCPSSC